MKTICERGVQIRTKACLEPPCKDEPKEVRECQTDLDIDLKEFCKDQYSKFGNVWKKNLKNLFIIFLKFRFISKMFLW